MNRYLISVAALALMAAPAFAQHDKEGHPGGGGAPHAQGPHGGPQTAPPGGGVHPLGGGAMRADHGGGGMRAAPAAPAPQAMRAEHNRGIGNAANNRPDMHTGNAPLVGNANVNRAMHDDRGGANNRGGFSGGHGGFAGRPGGNGGGRHNFTAFRDFHRAMSAPHRFHGPAYHPPRGYYAHRWNYGEILPSLFWAQDYWLSDYGDYDLPAPPWGATWVRVGADALLVDEDSGEIITVYYGVFY